MDRKQYMQWIAEAVAGCGPMCAEVRNELSDTIDRDDSEPVVLTEDDLDFEVVYEVRPRW